MLFLELPIINLSTKRITLFFFYKDMFYKNINAEIRKILRINPRLRYWRGYILCSKAVNTIQLYVFHLFHSLACSKRSDSGERCEVKKVLLFTSHRSPLSERLEQAIHSLKGKTRQQNEKTCTNYN